MEKKNRVELVTSHCRRLSEMQTPHRHCPEGIGSLPCGGASGLVLPLLPVSVSFAVGCGKTIAAPAIPAPEVKVAIAITVALLVGGSGATFRTSLCRIENREVS
jgi:hypothetical protein